MAAATASAAGVKFAGNSREVISVEPDSRSGLNAVYVVESTRGLSITFESPTALTWSRYSSMGGAYAEPVEPERNGNQWTLREPKADCGYLIELEGGSHFYFWLADWSATPFEANSLEVAATDCGTTELRFDGRAARMNYYSITGRSLDIDRQIEITYSTETWDDESARFVTTTATDSRPWLAENVSVPSPTASTAFTVSGDRFLRQWGEPDEVSTVTTPCVAVDAHVSAEQTQRDYTNEQNAGADGSLGGSAPAEIRFTADVTEAAIFTEWQIAADETFDLIDYRSNDLVLDYTFRDTGTFYVRFVAANADASCEYVSDVFPVFIGESALDCPNAFSPGTSEGVNDEWKVSYKSIVRFECHIFNKWGVKMAEFTDPGQGWDGKYGGKYVPAGVYYYVIKAEGADGKRYDRSGDINIIGYK